MCLNAVASMLTANLATASFTAMGTDHTVTVANPDVLDDAVDAAHQVIVSIDQCCSRFKVESELNLVNRYAGDGPMQISELLFTALSNAVHAAQATSGLVDLTVGRSLIDLGYSVTFAEINESASPVSFVHKPQGWWSVRLDERSRTVELPAGTVLDLGATGKAWAADLAAAAAAEAVDCAVIVASGGDVAIAGDGDGWDVLVSGGGAVPAPETTITLHEGGMATSAPSIRRWKRGDETVHHILDPLTGLPVKTPWAMVSVCASTCTGANAAATAALILGKNAKAWLDARQLPARLIPNDAGPPVVTKWWPQ
jgi:FAD:protein FMN transferase